MGSTATTGASPVSRTPTSLAILTEIPQATPLPRMMYRIDAVPLPREGDLRLPMDVDVTFDRSVAGLPAGDYLVYVDTVDHSVRYAPLNPSGDGGVLLAYGEARGLPTALVGDPGSLRLTADSANDDGIRYIYDLSIRDAWRVGPLCASSTGVSPDGRWVFARCGTEHDRLALDVVSAESGRGFHIELPVRPRPTIDWLGRDSFIVAPLDVEGALRPCVVYLLDELMYCPRVLQGWETIEADPRGRWLFLSALPNTAITSFDCLEPGKQCPAPVPLQEVDWDWIVWSPDGSMVAWTGYDRTNRTTTLGLFEAPGWDPGRILRKFSEDYLPWRWCPRADCIIVQKNLAPRTFVRVDMNGAALTLPYSQLIGVFNVP